MKIVLVENGRDCDGTKLLYLKSESHAEIFQIEDLFLQFRRNGVAVDDFDLDGDGVKSLRVRTIHMETGRPGGPPFKLPAKEIAQINPI